MGQGNRRAPRPRRKKRPSPVDIIAGIDASGCEEVAGEATIRRSPSRVIAEALGADAGLPGLRRRDAPLEVTWPDKRKRSRARSRDTGLVDRRDGASTAGEGFWSIWLQHQEYLRRHSLRWMSNNAQDAEDALSSAMLLAQQKYPEYARTITNIRAWLTRLVHNVCMDQHRASSRMEGFESDPQRDELERRAVINYHGVYPEPDQEAIEEERLISLLRGLHNLPASLREPLLLRCVYGVGYSEIAARMAISECAARKRVQLARDRLRAWSGSGVL
jgi:RNA polymerase sigma factor (sigma-70 family)